MGRFEWFSIKVVYENVFVADRSNRSSSSQPSLTLVVGFPGESQYMT